MTGKKSKVAAKAGTMAGYDSVLSGVRELLEAARRTSVRATNAIMTATYWEIGRRIVEHEQGSTRRAEYGELLLERLAGDLTKSFGRGFGRENLRLMRQFYVSYGCAHISRTLSGESITENPETASAQFLLKDIANRFPLPWSHYVRLLSIKSSEACSFYEAGALRGGWSVRQLDRQINSQFYERTARNVPPRAWRRFYVCRTPEAAACRG